MDSTYDDPAISKEDKIIDKYSDGIASLMEIVGYSTEEISKGNPESALSNLAADVLLFTAIPFIKPEDKCLSLTNFGGIRSNLPEGAIRIYDIYSTFPFDNTILIVDILGGNLRKILDSFAKRESFQALGGVDIEVKDKKIVKCNVAGAPLIDTDTYRLVTLDFLLDGGDSMNIGKYAIKIVNTGFFLRDGVIDYIKDKTAQGYIFNNSSDKRIRIISTDK